MSNSNRVTRRGFIKGVTGSLTAASGIGGITGTGRTSEGRAKSKIMQINKCPVHDGQLRHIGIDSLLKLMSDTGLKLYSSERATSGGMPYTLNLGTNDQGFIKQFHEAESNTENTFRWTKNLSAVHIPLQEGDAPLTLQLRINGWRPFNPPPTVTLRLNSHLLTTFSAERIWKTYTFTIPPELVAEGSLVLEIESETFVPSTCMNSSDSREIGVMVDWIKVN